VEEWLSIALKDWKRMILMRDNGDLEAAGFYLQQSLEKFLKAFLLNHGWKLRKTHELDSLLEVAIEILPDLIDYQETCERISGYYIIDRYPTFFSLGISSDDFNNDVVTSNKLIKILFPEIKL